jgi:hypothetical protein
MVDCSDPYANNKDAYDVQYPNNPFRSLYILKLSLQQSFEAIVVMDNLVFCFIADEMK